MNSAQQGMPFHVDVNIKHELHQHRQIKGKVGCSPSQARTKNSSSDFSSMQLISGTADSGPVQDGLRA